MNEYGMNEFEMVKKADVMRIINAENAVVLNSLKEISTDEVLCAIASQINSLQTTAKSGSRLIDADAFSEQYGNYYAEQGTEEGFIGTVGELIAQQPTIEAEPVLHGQWINDTFCSECKRFPVDVSVSISNQELTKYFSRCPHCGAVMDAQDGRC